MALNSRQHTILEFIHIHGQVTNRDLLAALVGLSRASLVRDLGILLRLKMIQKKGKGRSVVYAPRYRNPLVRYIDPLHYFSSGPDERLGVKQNFDFDVFTHLGDIIAHDDLTRLGRAQHNYKARIKKISPTILRRERERHTIEFSWKSSQIEGNTYDLTETETLIKDLQEAVGHPREEALMILNQKKALDYISARNGSFRTPTLYQIRSIHDIAMKDLGVRRGFRHRPVGITGTRYCPLDNQHQIQEAMERLARTLKGMKDPFSRALAAVLMISYIQPFEDGNKRTGRLLGNAILASEHCCMLSYRSVVVRNYKEALILFYEQNSALMFKDLFVEQFLFACDTYFRA